MSTWEPSLETAADGFSDIAAPERLLILDLLRDYPYDGLAYSEIMEKTDFTNSGRFDYHLKQLMDHYVMKSEGNYKLRPTGHRVLELVQRGEFTMHPTTDPVAIERFCQRCEVRVESWYEDGDLVAVCPDCHREVIRRSFPPRAVEAESYDRVLDAFSWMSNWRHALSGRGICPNCGCGLDREIDLDHFWDRFDYPATTECQCGFWTYSSVGLVLMTRPPVITFLWDHGIDALTTRWWHFPWTYHEEHASLLNADPTRVQVDIEAGDEVLEVTVANDFEILETVVE